VTLHRPRILLLGADGQVGHELRGALAPFADLVCATRATLDVGDAAALRSAVVDSAPAMVINATAYTDVDGAERDVETATRINRDAVAILGELARPRRFALVHYSTDFVFDGEATRPYREDDEAAPLSVYGRTKLEGERALQELDAPAIVLRTAWVYSLRRKSFVSTILRLARERTRLQVVADQIGNPTFARDLAAATAAIVCGVREHPFEASDDARGVYHAAGEGAVSRHELACAIVEVARGRESLAVETIDPVPTEAFPLPARRPRYAPLDGAKLRARFGVALPPWREALTRALS
jgi:dTDP-4-dehydrorhamnose reductase